MSDVKTMPFTVEPLQEGTPYGTVIRGLRAEHLADEGVREELRHHWIQDGVVVFKDGDCNEDFLCDLSAVFGALEVHPLKEAVNQKRPELITIFSKPGDNSIFEVEGEQGANWLGWHSDLCYVERINHGGILRAIKPTEHGGLTGFIDQVTAYDTLPDDLKAKIENLSVVYKMGAFDLYRYGYSGELKILHVSDYYRKVWDTTDNFPAVSHPMVFVQPETGRKVLHISPFFAMYIEGMENEEGDALLKQLCDHILACPIYRHKWGTDELVLWDNWRVLHSVTPIAPDEERIMQRTTIKGDYGLGRLAQLPKAA
jgi:taurine dioxygenase